MNDLSNKNRRSALFWQSSLFMKGSPLMHVWLLSAHRRSPPKSRSRQDRGINIYKTRATRGHERILSVANLPQLYIDGKFVGGCDITWISLRAASFKT